MSICTTSLNEERSALTKAVGYGSADSNLMTGGFRGGGLLCERFLAVRTRVLLAIRLDLRTGDEEMSGVTLVRFTCPYKTKQKTKKQLISKFEKPKKKKKTESERVL